jgi:hypothetical protein
MPEKNYGIPQVDPVPDPTPEHQRKILKEKWFEIITVITLIITGTSFLMWRSAEQGSRPYPGQSIAQSVKAVEDNGAKADGTVTLFGREFLTFARTLDDFVFHVDLVGAGQDAPLETAIVWLTPVAGRPAPSVESLQKVVNDVSELGQILVPTTSEALVTASKTMEFMADAKRPHEKGVAATSDGWKLTYVTYRSFDDGAAPQPMLCLILQRLSTGESEALGEMNRVIFDALNQGLDIKTALRAAEAAKAPPAGA